MITLWKIWNGFFE